MATENNVDGELEHHREHHTQAQLAHLRLQKRKLLMLAAAQPSFIDELASLRALGEHHFSVLPPEIMQLVLHFYETELVEDLKNEVEKVTFLFIGDAQAGKSSLVQRYADNIYQESAKQFAVNVYHRYLIYSGRLVKLALIDTNNVAMHARIINRAHACVVVTDKSSFSSAPGWLRHIDSYSQNNSLWPVKILCSTKSDNLARKIFNAFEQIETGAGQKLAQKNGALFVEVSAKDNVNVTAMFSMALESIFERKREEAEREAEDGRGKRSTGNGGACLVT